MNSGPHTHWALCTVIFSTDVRERPKSFRLMTDTWTLICKGVTQLNMLIFLMQCVCEHFLLVFMLIISLHWISDIKVMSHFASGQDYPFSSDSAHCRSGTPPWVHRIITHSLSTRSLQMNFSVRFSLDQWAVPNCLSPNAVEDLSSGTENQANLSKGCALDESIRQSAMSWLIICP